VAGFRGDVEWCCVLVLVVVVVVELGDVVVVWLCTTVGTWLPDRRRLRSG